MRLYRAATLTFVASEILSWYRSPILALVLNTTSTLIKICYIFQRMIIAELSFGLFFKRKKKLFSALYFSFLHPFINAGKI